MAKLPPNLGLVLLLGGAIMSLVSCAAPSGSKTAMRPEVQTATPQGNIIPGVVVAVRPVTAQGALSPGSAAVLAALQVSAPARPPDATEFVIQRNDGNVAAIVLRAPETSPTASLAAADFSIGDQVELITGQQTELIHRP